MKVTGAEEKAVDAWSRDVSALRVVSASLLVEASADVSSFILVDSGKKLWRFVLLKITPDHGAE
mgnify:CR=1 FL=1